MDVPSEPVIVEMSFPTRVALGAGALQRVLGQLAQLGIKRPLVMADQAVVKAGLGQRLYDALKFGSVEFARFEQVSTVPTDGEIAAGLEAFRGGACDGVIGIGAEGPLDAAKLVALMASHEPPLSRYGDAAGGARHVRDVLPPMVAIATTAGCGAEVSASAAVLLEATGRTLVVDSPHLMPDLAVCDPELTYGLPAGPTAGTGMEAFARCLEAYVATGFHPLADAVAIDGVSRVARSLLIAVKEGDHLVARTDMMVAAIEGAMASQKGRGAAAALARSLAQVSGIERGLAIAVLLPTVLEFNRAACTGRLARVAVALGDNSYTREEVLAGNAIDRVRRMKGQIGIPEHLQEVGVREADLPEIARRAFQDAAHLTNPRKCSEEDLRSLVRAAY